MRRTLCRIRSCKEIPAVKKVISSLNKTVRAVYLAWRYERTKDAATFQGEDGEVVVGLAVDVVLVLVAVPRDVPTEDVVFPPPPP